VYYAKFESVLKYGIFFGVVSKRILKPYLNCKKKCVRVIKGEKNRVSCRNLFRELKILTGTSLYIFEIICFKKKNKIYTTLYSDVHEYNTIHKQNLYVQFCNTGHSK
jgi:hypothetical protein